MEKLRTTAFLSQLPLDWGCLDVHLHQVSLEPITENCVPPETSWHILLWRGDGAKVEGRDQYRKHWCVKRQPSPAPLSRAGYIWIGITQDFQIKSSQPQIDQSIIYLQYTTFS